MQRRSGLKAQPRVGRRLGKLIGWGKTEGRSGSKPQEWQREVSLRIMEEDADLRNRPGHVRRDVLIFLCESWSVAGSKAMNLSHVALFEDKA